MKIIFMGTPDFAVPSLDIINKNHEVAAVFTKVDKPNSRGKKIIFTPVKEYSIENNLKIYQPESFKDDEIYEEIKKINPDLIVVVAYGKILPKRIIDIPKYGTINLHSSLLPKYRGAAPINAALINGDETTGVSIMYIEEKLDAGPVILKKEVKIENEDNFLTLHDRMKEVGAELLMECINLLEEGKQNPEVQDEKKVTFVKPFRKEDCKIDWSKSSREIYNFIRGMSPLPCAYTSINQKKLKIYSTKIYDKKYENSKNGEVVDFVRGEGILIKTKDSCILINDAKPEGKKRMSGTDLINGKFFKIGEILC